MPTRKSVDKVQARSEVAKRAVATRRRREAASKAVEQRRKPTSKAKAAERGSKHALTEWCKTRGWMISFFESKSGSPLTGIVDAVMLRKHPVADGVQFRLMQLKSGNSGVTGSEVRRLKKAIQFAAVRELFVWFDGRSLEFYPDNFEE